MVENKKPRGRQPRKVAEPEPEMAQNGDNEPSVEESLPLVPPPRKKNHEYVPEMYVRQIFFDKAENKYVASVFEFPDLEVVGEDSFLILDQLERRLKEHLDQFKLQDKVPPSPYYYREFPHTMELNLSQTLYRKLDLVSKHERIPIDKLITEFIVAGITSRQNGRLASSHRPHNNHNRQHFRRSHQERHHNNPRPQYQESEQQGDGFLEYVRNLEKTGGAAPRRPWRKK